MQRVSRAAQLVIEEKMARWTKADYEGIAKDGELCHEDFLALAFCCEVEGEEVDEAEHQVVEFCSEVASSWTEDNQERE